MKLSFPVQLKEWGEDDVKQNKHAPLVLFSARTAALVNMLGLFIEKNRGDDTHRHTHMTTLYAENLSLDTAISGLNSSYHTTKQLGTLAPFRRQPQLYHRRKGESLRLVETNASRASFDVFATFWANLVPRGRSALFESTITVNRDIVPWQVHVDELETVGGLQSTSRGRQISKSLPTAVET